FLWTLTCLMAYLLARRVVRPRTALLSAGLTALYPEFVGMTGLLWSENLFILLVVAVMYALFRARQSGGQATWWIITGILFGLSTLTRTMMLILLPLVWYAAISAYRWRRGAALSLLATVAAFAVVGCWTARNWNVHHRF